MPFQNPGNDFRDETWTHTLRAYCQELVTYLAGDLRRLAQAGIPLPRASRQTLFIQEADPSQEQAKSWRGDGREETDDRRALMPLVEDLVLFRQWISRASGPLLLLAPFGSGKSVLLAMFACEQAEAVLRWCDDRVAQGPPPAVPLPIRLRGWNCAERESFRQYAFCKSQVVLDPNAESLVSSDQWQALEAANALLPLYDGLDELPQEARGVAIDAMKRTHRRFILTSRPGHGAEEAFEDSQRHAIRELTTADGEAFIQRRLKPQKHAAAMEAYRRAQPDINDLFCRPLFLNAWCKDFEATGIAPETLTHLMAAVLDTVFDDRVFADPSEFPVFDRASVQRHRHVLGALLTAYAERGFGKTCQKLDIEQWLRSNPALSDVGQIARWRALAVRVGLLIATGTMHFVIKIPVVEYLIGSYYAWLADQSEERARNEVGGRHQRLFIERFRQGFWWREFEEVWLFTFDQLWRGSDTQVVMAESVVQWLLAFSARCVESGQWTGDLLPGQVEEDREPFTCHRFVLRVLLPTTRGVPTVDARIAGWVQTGLDQIVNELELTWRHRGVAGDINLLSRKRPADVTERLLTLVCDPVKRDVIRRVVEVLRNIVDWIDSVSAVKVVQTLMSCLGQDRYKDAEYVIADTIGKALMRVEPAQASVVVAQTLASCLRQDRYKDAWWHIVSAVCGALRWVKPAQASAIVAQTLGSV